MSTSGLQLLHIQVLPVLFTKNSNNLCKVNKPLKNDWLLLPPIGSLTFLENVILFTTQPDFQSLHPNEEAIQLPLPVRDDSC